MRLLSSEVHEACKRPPLYASARVPSSALAQSVTVPPTVPLVGDPIAAPIVADSGDRVAKVCFIILLEIYSLIYLNLKCRNQACRRPLAVSVRPQQLWQTSLHRELFHFLYNALLKAIWIYVLWDYDLINRQCHEGKNGENLRHICGEGKKNGVATRILLRKKCVTRRGIRFTLLHSYSRHSGWFYYVRPVRTVPPHIYAGRR